MTSTSSPSPRSPSAHSPPSRRPVPFADRSRKQSWTALALFVLSLVSVKILVHRRLIALTVEDAATQGGIDLVYWLTAAQRVICLGFFAFFMAQAIRWSFARRKARAFGWMCCPCCQSELATNPDPERRLRSMRFTCPECAVRGAAEQICKHWKADKAAK